MEQETTPVYHTHSAPEQTHTVEITTGVLSTATLTQGPTRFAPTLVTDFSEREAEASNKDGPTLADSVADVTHKQIRGDGRRPLTEERLEGACPLAESESDEFTLTSESEDSENEGDGNFEPVNGVKSEQNIEAVLTSMQNSRRKDVGETGMDTTKTSENTLSDSSLSSEEIVEEVVEEYLVEKVHAANEHVEASEPLSNSTREQLKIDLNKLVDSSADPTPLPSSSTSSEAKPFSYVRQILLWTFLLVLVIVVLAYVAFENDSEYLLSLRQSDLVQQINMAYYQPVRDRVVKMLSGYL